MNTAVLIASRELRDRARLFLIAAAMAVVPFGAALAVREHRQMAIATVAGFLAAAYTGALAVALGVSSVGRDLTEKRLSFFFSKPVSAASIWIGKAMAGLLTLAGAFAIVVLPAFLLANDGWSYNWPVGGRALATYTLIMSTVLFFASHAASTMLRSRSALVAVDFVLLAAMLTAILAITRPILLGGGLDLVLKMLLAIGVALLAILIVAPIWQLARGRVDPRRNHAAFSLVLWGGAAVVVAVAGGYALWVISAPLSSLTNLYNVEQSPAGQWLSVSGRTVNRGEYLASFLVDAATGERERVTALPWSTVHVSRDGKTAVWMESDELVPRNGMRRVHMRRLEPGAKQIATQLVMGQPRMAQLSDDGSRLAITTRDKIEVYEVSTGRLLGATTGIGSTTRQSLFFAGPDVVRLLEISYGPAAKMSIREFDLRRRKLTTTVQRPSPRSPIVQVTRDGSRLYLRQDGLVLDTHTGNVLANLPVKPARPFYSAMLNDGSIVVTRDSKLRHFDSNGVLVAEIPIPVQQAGVVGQVGESKVLLTSGAASSQDWRMLIVDLSARKVAVVIPGLRSALAWWSDPVLPRFTEDAAIAAMDGERKLVLVDARTGARRPFPS
jgi:ABC-type transport system involved in multi-copper enzyme maturation permease subunit